MRGTDKGMARLPGGGETGATAGPDPKGQSYHAAQSPTGRETGLWPRPGVAAGTWGPPAAQTSKTSPLPQTEPPPDLQSTLSLLYI